MKEIIALVVFATITIFAITQVLKKKFDKFTAIWFLSFAVVSGIAIANYDVITNLRWGGLQ